MEDYKYYQKNKHRMYPTTRQGSPLLCDYARSIELLPTEPEQLLEMTELVPCPVLCAEVFRNHIGAATLGGCLQLHNRLPWKPWHLLLERTHDRCLPRRLRWLTHKCIGPPLLNGGTSLPPDHSNSHPPFLCKPGPPWPIERTKCWTPCPMLLKCFRTPPSLVPPLLWAHVSLPVYVHWTALLLHSPRMPLCQRPHAIYATMAKILPP
jgi:hypothetical protein